MPTSTPSRPDADRRPRPIAEIARDLGLGDDEWIPYGHDKAKVRVAALAARAGRPDGKLVVVSSITPTPAGDGKTTMTIGLGQALWRVGGRPVIALRGPSIGPTLCMKGGGTGGGRSQVVPMDEINLHFTGDFHAITSAHNLLAAALDNHVHHGNPLGIDVRQVAWKRILDVNARALRNVIVGLGGRMDGVPREGGFLITSASEIMAALCLAEDLMDLKQRLGRMLVALTADGVPVPELDRENVAALTTGLDNLEAHVEAVRQFKVPVLIGLNRYPSDTEREYAAVRERCRRLGVEVHVADVFGRGGEGGEQLARGLQKLLATERSGFQPLYALDDPITVKLDTIARRIYGADGVEYPERVERQIAQAESLGYGRDRKS